MGSYDGAEICELVGLYLLNQLSTAIHKSSVGLYRDDGLVAINNANGPKLGRIRKYIIASFTIKTNLIETDFLMLPSTLRQRNTFLFERLTTHHSTSTPFLTTHLQSSSSCLKLSTRGFQIYLVIKKNLTKLNWPTNQH